METFNLLAVSVEIMNGFGSPFTLNWIGKIIQWLINSCNSIGLGIILFTLAIKLITLPLDIISRTSMQKNNLKMRNMREKLEKYQRQYANNKELYNKKIQALYKKEGYSMFSSCLPTLVTLIFFIVVINQFSTYSNYTSLQIFNDMSLKYNQAIEQVDSSIIYKETNQEGVNVYYLNETNVFNSDYFKDYREFISAVPGEKSYEAKFSATDVNKLGALVKTLNENGYSDVKAGDDENTCHLLINGETYSFNSKMYQNITEAQINEQATTKVMGYLFEQYKESEILSTARASAAQSYYEQAPSFLWIKNLWMPDLPFKHPVNNSITDYDFARQLGNAESLQAQYEEITHDLAKEKTQPNGYFILVILSIGTMLLSQILMTKSQKDQLELQSVDGQSMAQSKMMMWIMPIMFGVFSFFYSSSFSLYMTVSTVFSMISTLIINFCVEKSFQKKYGK